MSRAISGSIASLIAEGQPMAYVVGYGHVRVQTARDIAEGAVNRSRQWGRGYPTH